MFGMGGGGEASSEQDNPTTAGGEATGADLGETPTQNTNEWGDPFLTDEQAGVTNPSDGGSFLDSLKDFFPDDE